MAVKHKSKKSKRPDNCPARARYWASGRLKARKVRNLVRHNGMEKKEAEVFWLSVRVRHRTKLGITSLGEDREKKAA